MMATWAGERRDFFRDRGGMRKIVWMLGALQFLCLFHCFVFRSYFFKYYHPAEDEKWKCCKLCSHPVIGWPDAPPGIFGLWFIQVATV
jgi:hypothetical protein